MREELREGVMVSWLLSPACLGTVWVKGACSQVILWTGYPIPFTTCVSQGVSEGMNTKVGCPKRLQDKGAHYLGIPPSTGM